MVDINELMLSKDANFKEYATFFMKLRGDCKSKEEEEQYFESLYSLCVKNAQEAFEQKDWQKANRTGYRFISRQIYRIYGDGSNC